VPGSGQFIIVEKHEELAAILVRFLKTSLLNPAVQ